MWLYGYVGRTMKTTVDLPDDLYRTAKAQAALSGRKVRDLIEDGLRYVLKEGVKEKDQRTLAERMEKARGMIDSGIPDLATNPKYMEDFGRDGRRDR